MSWMGSFVVGFLTIIVSFAGIGAIGVIVISMKISMPQPEGYVPGMITAMAVVLGIGGFLASKIP